MWNVKTAVQGDYMVHYLGALGGRGAKEAPTIPAIFLSLKHTHQAPDCSKYVKLLAFIKYRQRFYGCSLYYLLILSLCIFLYAWTISLKINMCYWTTYSTLWEVSWNQRKVVGLGSVQILLTMPLTSYMVLSNSPPFWEFKNLPNQIRLQNNILGPSSVHLMFHLLMPLSKCYSPAREIDYKKIWSSTGSTNPF